MTKKFMVLFAAIAFLTTSAQASDDSQLLQKLGEAKFSLLDAITHAEKISGPATSAKFEMDGDQLVFSVYTAPQGLKISPEETELTELSGSATLLPIQSKVEVFTDKPHIARASTHQTLMQLSNLNLKEVVAKALRIQKGQAYSVKNPMVRDHRAVADVLILTPDGKSATVTVNLQ
jgi:hypothetical protein